MLSEQFDAKTCPEAFLQQTITELRSNLAKAEAVIEADRLAIDAALELAENHNVAELEHGFKYRLTAIEEYQKGKEA